MGSLLMKYLRLHRGWTEITPRTGLVPTLAGILACVLWVTVHVHLGLTHQVVPSLRDRDWQDDAGLLGVLFAATALGSSWARVVLAQAVRVARPGSALDARARPLTRENLLAAASFGAYIANPACRRFASVSGRAWIAYRRAGPILIALGGPTGEVNDAPELQRRFLDWARWWPLVWYGAGTAGRRSLRIGQEAIIELAGYRIDHPQTANLRHSVTRARRAGVETFRGSWSSFPGPVRRQLHEVAREWRRQHPLPLRLTVSRLDDAARDDRQWVVALRRERVEACVTWLPAGDGRGLVLDLMRRRRDAVPGVMELLIHEGLLEAQGRSLEWASLGVCCCTESVPRRLRWPLTTLNPPSLRRFKQKFDPRWHDRYILAPELPPLLTLLAVGWAHLRLPRLRMPTMRKP